MKGYTFRGYSHEHMAMAVGISLPISFKQSVEVCRFIKNKNVNEAKRMLQDTIDKKISIRFRKYNWDLGHKKKVGPARNPEKASRELIRLIESAESNAQFKGLDTSNLVIAHISAHKASKVWHSGRKSRRRMKRTNIEIVVKEKAKAEEKKQIAEQEKQKND